MARRRRSLMQRTKVAIQHAHTEISNTGSASAPNEMVILVTETGARSTTGNIQTTKSFASTGDTVNIGDKVKYVNLMVQAGPRANVDTAQDRTGWLEWAFVCVKESETAVPITQLGTLSLGTVCTNMFRNECIYTGSIPVGGTQPSQAEIKLKIPPSKQSIRIGDEWRFVTYFRSVESTSTSTAVCRLVKSCMFKSYS